MGPVNPKHMTAVLLVAVMIFEIRKGFFRQFFAYLKACRWTALLPLVTATAVLTVLTMFVDAQLLHFVLNAPRSIIDPIADFGGALGRGSNCWTFLGWAYLLAFFIRWQKGRGVLFGCLVSSMLTALFTTLAKFVFLRARPYGELGAVSFFNIDGLIRDERVYQSFPSGDVAIVAGAAAYLFFNLKENILRWALLLLPLTTAVARMNANKHWPSDTLFSIGLGFIAALWVWNYQAFKSRVSIST